MYRTSTGLSPSLKKSVIFDHHTKDLIEIFNNAFSNSENTLLELSRDEPVYLPADTDNSFNRVLFANGFFSSALHEVAHWCVAGSERRKILDYGYWYVADGRNAGQQREFEKVEVFPQALEWIFSQACSRNFRLSVDNLSGEEIDQKPFKRAVYKKVLDLCRDGLNSRAELFHSRLCEFYQSPTKLTAALFRFEGLSL